MLAAAPLTTVLANLALVLGGLPMLLLIAPGRRTGPEGPVGAHMVTAPLALAVALAIGLGVAGGLWDAAGWPRFVLYAALPGLGVALTVAAIPSHGARGRRLGVAAVLAALAGGGLVVDGAWFGDGRLAAWVGGAAVLAVAAGGYGLLLAWWNQALANQARAIEAEVARQDRFQTEQQQFQRAEWAKLPPSPELWQLIQFTHAFAPEVRAACRDKIRNLPDPNAAMYDLLGTGWAEHALSYFAEAWPLPSAALAEPLSRFLLAEAERWRSVLDPRSNPGSWYANLVKHIAAAERVAADGGDVRAAMVAWAELLRGKPGLEGLAARAQQLARATAVRA